MGYPLADHFQPLKESIPPPIPSNDPQANFMQKLLQDKQDAEKAANANVTEMDPKVKEKIMAVRVGIQANDQHVD